MSSGDGSLGILLRLVLTSRARLFEIAGRAPCLRDSRYGVLENQLLLRGGLHDQRKLIKALNAAQELRAIHQIDGHRDLFPAGEIEKAVLNILWRLL